MKKELITVEAGGITPLQNNLVQVEVLEQIKKSNLDINKTIVEKLVELLNAKTHDMKGNEMDDNVSIIGAIKQLIDLQKGQMGMKIRSARQDIDWLNINNKIGNKLNELLIAKTHDVKGNIINDNATSRKSIKLILELQGIMQVKTVVHVHFNIRENDKLIY